MPRHLTNNRTFNIKDQKPLKQKHARGGSLQWLRILPMSSDSATEWNFLVKILRGCLKQDHIKHYRLKQSGIRENSFFSLNTTTSLIWGSELETNTPTRHRQLKGFSPWLEWQAFHGTCPCHPSAAPLFQRKAVQALAPATTPALLPKPNPIPKERIFFLAGSETFKDNSNWTQHW